MPANMQLFHRTHDDFRVHHFQTSPYHYNPAQYPKGTKPRMPRELNSKLLYFELSPPWHLYVLLLANLLAFYLTYLLAFYLAYLLAFYPAYLLAYLLAFYLAYLLQYVLANVSGILSGKHSGNFYLAHMMAFFWHITAFYQTSPHTIITQFNGISSGTHLASSDMPSG